MLDESSEIGRPDRLHFLMTSLEQPLVLKLVHHVARLDDPYAVHVLGAIELDPLSIPEKSPFDRISRWAEPSKFTSHNEALWCLLNKGEALDLHREYVEDPRYTDDSQQTNYFKNSVDVFLMAIQERKW